MAFFDDENDPQGGINQLPGGAPPAAKKTGGLLKTGLSLLSASNPYVGAVMNGIDLVGGIANFFKKSPDDKDKEQATYTQQNIQNVAFQIEQMVNSGQMRPEAALVALDSLAKQAGVMGTTPGMTGSASRNAAGSQTAQLIINQVKANIQTKLMNNNDAFVNAPWRTTEGPGMEGGKVPNLNDAGANEDLQKTRIRTGLRNYLIGADNSLDNTPLTSGFKPKSPYDMLPKAQEAVDTYFKPAQAPPRRY